MCELFPAKQTNSSALFSSALSLAPLELGGSHKIAGSHLVNELGPAFSHARPLRPPIESSGANCLEAIFHQNQKLGQAADSARRDLFRPCSFGLLFVQIDCSRPASRSPCSASNGRHSHNWPTNKQTTCPEPAHSIGHHQSKTNTNSPSIACDLSVRCVWTQQTAAITTMMINWRRANANRAIN